MSYTVTLYFDNMIDETHYFDEKEEAMKCKADLGLKYYGQRLYRVKMEKVK